MSCIYTIRYIVQVHISASFWSPRHPRGRSEEGYRRPVRQGRDDGRACRSIRRWRRHDPQNAAPFFWQAPLHWGRPFAASEAQVERVRRLHKQGIVIARHRRRDQPRRTVRTIVDQGDGRDRTTIKHLERIAISKHRGALCGLLRSTRTACGKLSSSSAGSNTARSYVKRASEKL